MNSLKFLLTFLFFNQAIFKLLNNKEREKTQSQNIVLREFDSDEGNCNSVRKILQALPAMKQVKAGVLNYFKKSKKRQLKAFRGIAFNILKAINFSDEEDRVRTLETIQALAQKKATYFENYRQDIALDTDDEDLQKQKLEKQQVEVSNAIKEALKKLLTGKGRHLKTFLEVKSFVVSELKKTDPDSIKLYIKDIKLVQKFSDMIRVFYYQKDKTDEFTNFVSMISNGDKSVMKSVDDIIKSHNELGQIQMLREVVFFYQELVDFKVNGPDPSKYQIHVPKKLKDDKAKIKRAEDKLSKIMDKAFKNLEGFFKKTILGIKEKFVKGKPYKNYVKNINILRKIKHERVKDHERLENLQEELQNILLRLGNLDRNELMDFTIAQNAVENLERKMHILETRSQILDPTIIDDNSSSIMKDGVKIVIEKMVAAYRVLEDHSAEMLTWMKGKLTLTREIQQLEARIDRRLGDLFGSLQHMADGYRCFKKSEISYIIFSLVKGNMIINEKEFLIAFFENLPYLYKKEFIIYNYSFFTNKDFIEKQIKKDDYILGLDDYRWKIQQQVVDTYINNWCFMINMYKDYTEFGNQDENEDIKKVKLSTRIARQLGMTAEKMFKLSKDSGYGEYFGVFAGEFLKMIPFLGNIPFLTTIIATILSYICDFAIDLIKRAFDRAEPVIKVFMEHMAKVFTSWKKFEIIDLDYSHYIRGADDLHVEETMNTESENAKITVKIYEYEKKYIRAVEAENSVENNTDSLYLFHSDGNILPLKKLGLEIVRDGLESLNQTQRLENSEYAKYKKFISEYEGLLEERQRAIEYQNQVADSQVVQNIPTRGDIQLEESEVSIEDYPSMTADELTSVFVNDGDFEDDANINGIMMKNLQIRKVANGLSANKKDSRLVSI